jgi:hypothetical protein
MMQATIATIVSEKNSLISKVESSEANALHMKEELERCKQELANKQNIIMDLQEVRNAEI